MRTSTLVQATADIITVVSLRTGDVYKRLEKDYSGGYTVQFGVVQDVMHNGEDAVITALEFAASYTGVEPKYKVFGTDSDLKLFAATPDEVRHHFEELVETTQRAVQTAEVDLTKKREMAARVAALVATESARELTTAVTSTKELESV